jgi:hypothetical protein
MKNIYINAWLNANNTPINPANVREMDDRLKSVNRRALLTFLGEENRSWEEDLLRSCYPLFGWLELRLVKARFQSLFLGHDFMECRGDWSDHRNDEGWFFAQCPSCDELYDDYVEQMADAEMLRRAENEPYTDGPVEGEDSHAYYGPMSSMTNFIESQRDREFD